MDVPLRFRWDVGVDSRDLGNGAEDECAAGMAGLGRFLFAIVALLRILGPLGAWLSLLWIIAVSLLTLADRVGATSSSHIGTVRSSQ